MFKPAKMKKVKIVVLQSYRDSVVSRLHSLGMIQLKESSTPEFVKKAVGDEFREISETISRLGEAQSVLGKIRPKHPIKVKEHSVEKTIKNARKTLERIEPKVKSIVERRQGLSKEQQKLLGQIETLHVFSSVKFPLKYLNSTEEFYISVGRISSDVFEEFSAAAAEALESKILVRPIVKGETQTILIACRRRDQPKLAPVIYRYGVELLDVPPTSAVPKKAADEIEKRLSKINRDLVITQNEISILARKWSIEVGTHIEILEIQKERLSACSNFGYSEMAVLIEGWVPEKNVEKFEGELSNVTNGRHIFHVMDPSKEEVEAAPTKLENPAIVKDFEMITEMYGSPSPTEADPTPFIAITFPLFFGMTLGDIGYGALLAIIMYTGFWIGGAFPKNFRRMFIVSGLMAMVFGVLTGSLFGPSIPALWADSVKDPVSILKLAIFIGVLHIFFAFALVKFLKDAFRGDWKKVFFEDISRALVIAGFFGLGFCILGISLNTFGINFAFPKMGLVDAFNPLGPASTVAVVLRAMFFFGLLSGIVGAIATSEGARSKFSGAINVVYGIINFVADVVSYSRLMALGVAGAVIAYLLNFILLMTFDGMVRPNLVLGPGILLAIAVMIGIAFIFIAGHAFNIFLGSMGGFIHTLRLHFAEFFSKFYEGSGEKFAPFKVKREYTEVKGGELIGS